VLASDPMRLTGPMLDAHDAKQPERVTLAGRSITLAPLDAEKHAEALYEGPIGNAVRDSVRAYKFNGPFTSFSDFPRARRPTRPGSRPIGFDSQGRQKHRPSDLMPKDSP
jgi:hypothetical protein